jgi:para-aminobenzoate synthetase/4-amino-4-deoxychorismate lyase
VRLAELEPLPSFALLGPGFAGGGFRLLSGLESGAPDGPTLLLASFESAGAAAERWGAARSQRVDLELTPPPRSPSVLLEAPDHAEKVARIREAIARGDVYQVCLTERARVEGVGAAELFAGMCARGVPRFAAWVRLPDGRELVSASPELFFETEGGRVHAQPMKGTARPGARGELQASEKDRAELAMITDLLRNDLAPVCLEKSVRVENPRRVLELGYALQTVSDVVGDLSPQSTPLAVLAALHPGGSVTGAPKRAALEMIGALEPTGRGAYCGALGLWEGERSVFSLLIRTAQRSGAGWIYGVGGGVVYDSTPEGEWAELQVKLGALRWPTRS